MQASRQIDMSRIPHHVAIIMDGNGRWAEQQGATRTYGHRQALQAVEESIEACEELHIPYLTLYVFSKENWQRPKEEVDLLMDLLISNLKAHEDTFSSRQIRLSCLGDLSTLPPRAREMLKEITQATRAYQGLHLCLALNYSGRWDILQATRSIATDVQKGLLSVDEINESNFEKALDTRDIPDPELLIRTSGEQRISNFLLWQIAYTELYVTEVFWPEFRKTHLQEAILSYQQRERRFGKISAQIKP